MHHARPAMSSASNVGLARSTATSSRDSHRVHPPRRRCCPRVDLCGVGVRTLQLGAELTTLARIRRVGHCDRREPPLRRKRLSQAAHVAHAAAAGRPRACSALAHPAVMRPGLPRSGRVPGLFVTTLPAPMNDTRERVSAHYVALAPMLARASPRGLYSPSRHMAARITRS